jgi:hypothetical protein
MTDSALLEEVRKLRQEVQELRDRQAIHDVLVRYSRGLDRHDSELLASVYHEDAIDHHGNFLGPPADFVPWVNGLHEEGYVAHQHFVTNATIDVDGDQAHSEIYCLVILRRKEGPVDICGGRYLDRLERRDGVWRVAARETLVDWACTVEGDVWPGIAMFPMGEWNRSDASYQRPLQVPAEGGRPVGG